MSYGFGLLEPGSLPMSAANYTAVSAGTDLPDSLGSFYLSPEEQAEAERQAAAKVRENQVQLRTFEPVPDLGVLATQTFMFRRALAVD